MKPHKSIPFLSIIFLFLFCFQTFSQNGWYRLNSGVTSQLNSVYNTGMQVSAVGNNGIILRTSNQGNNWSVIPSGTAQKLNCIIFRPDYFGYIVGNAGTILISTNEGLNWQQVNSNTGQNLNYIWPLWDTSTVLVCGDNGTILKSTNRGTNWSQVTSPVSGKLNCIVSGFPGDIFICGDSGKMLFSDSWGSFWIELNSGTTQNLNAFSVINFWNFTSVVHCVGNNGIIIKTQNSGVNWNNLNSGTTENLRSIDAVNMMGDSVLYFIACGDNGKMVESVNGNIWSNRSNVHNDNLYCIDMENFNRGYAVGSNGTILKSRSNYINSDIKKLDANTISSSFKNDGGFNSKNASDSSGFEWPKNSGKFARFKSGLWIGARVNGLTRLAVAEYNTEFYPGYTENTQPKGRNDTNYRIYKLTYGQPGTDRLLWPNSVLGNSNQGAPVYFDSSSSVWKALDFGSQTMFCLFTDSYPESHLSYYAGTLPLKADVSQLSFSLDVNGPLGNTIFTQHTIINRSSETWNDVYLTLWSDDDLGDGYDDLIGCDSALKLGYTYNSTDFDQVYGAAPPAVGFTVLKGASINTGVQSDSLRICKNKTPVLKTGYKDLGINVFNFSRNANIIYHDPENSTETYNLVQGLYLDGQTIYHPQGYATKLIYSGDPEAGTGWLSYEPDDYRILISTGPFTMQPGDTQVIVTAQVIAKGSNNLSSVTLLKSYISQIRQFYNSCYTSTPIGLNNNNSIIKEFELMQNYPNPFNPVTTIKYNVEKPAVITLRIYDILGREVFYKNDFHAPGSYAVKFDGSGLASGVYFYTIEALYSGGRFSDTKKMLLVK